jgi:hypothetical protein
MKQIIRQFDIELEDPGKYLVTAGIGYNVGFMVKVVARE